MRSTTVLLLTVALAGAACANREVALRPAPQAETAMLPDGGLAVVDEVSGVRINARPQAWTGSAAVTRVVVPLRLRIDNNSGKAIRIRYDEIVLTGPEGQTLAALPPYSIDTTVTVPKLRSGYPVVGQPDFERRGFRVSPLYAPAFTGMQVATNSAFYSPRYYGYHGSHWRRVPLPTPEMLRLALPEGTLDPGGSVEGFIYFQKPDTGIRHVNLRMKIVGAEDGFTLGTTEMPFIVALQ